jgi:hypothetical protein
MLTNTEKLQRATRPSNLIVGTAQPFVNGRLGDREVWRNVMKTIAFLKDQLERARRFASALTGTDRDRFLAVADDYQRQIDAASAPADHGVGQQTEATATTGDASSEAVSSDDETPTTSTSGQPETD